jgi:hypothetical protein
MVDNLMEKSQYHQPSLPWWFHREITRGSLGQIHALPPERALEEDVHDNILKHWSVHYQHQRAYQHSSCAAIDSTYQQTAKDQNESTGQYMQDGDIEQQGQQRLKDKWNFISKHAYKRTGWFREKFTWRKVEEMEKKKLNPNLTPGQGAKVQKSTWHVG